MDFPDQGVGADRLGLPLDGELAEVLEGEEALREAVGPCADHDFSRATDAEESGGEIRGVPHGGVVHPQIVPDGADDDEARVDPHAGAESHPVRLSDLPLER